jgi:7-cyano-7-deazaguanine synthase in queuosine biosynthesis
VVEFRGIVPLLQIATLATRMEPKKYCLAPFQLDGRYPCGECDGCKLHEALQEWKEINDGSHNKV